MYEQGFDLKLISRETIKIIGAELKRRRILRSRTLDSSQCGYSISYISKIENGKIVPKANILRELCLEQGISDEEITALINVDASIKKCIEALFWDNDNVISKIYDCINTFDNYKANLIKIMYEIRFLHWDKISHLLNSIKIIENNLEEKDYYLYIYLSIFLANKTYNYPKVYELYREMYHCKDDYLCALAAKEMFIAVCHFGLENPLYLYNDYNKKYTSLLNYKVQDMYNLLLETLIKHNYHLPESIQSELKPDLKLRYYIINRQFDKLSELLKEYRPTTYERLLIETAMDDFDKAEKTFKKIQIYKLSAKEIIIANFCNALNMGNDEETAKFIIEAGLDYAKKTNDGVLFKIFLKKLSELSFFVGKYKTVAAKNIEYFEMLGKCRVCLL